MSVFSRSRQVLLASAAVPLLFGALVPLQKRIDTRTATIAQEKQDLLLRSPALLKKISLGYSPLLADIYWTRAIQYYGRNVQASDPNFELLPPLLDLTVGLDPSLTIAYKVGAILLSDPKPVGAGRPDLAATLVERGIAANPNDWWLKADLGFIYYWYLQEPRKAADAYLAGSKDPGAPVWMKAMAARVLEQSGTVELSISIWSQVYESTDDINVQRNALRHLQALYAQRDIQRLDNLLDQYTQKFQESPSSFEELVEGGILPQVPRDPTGTPYTIDPDGQVQLSPLSSIDLRIVRPLSAPRTSPQAAHAQPATTP